MPTTSTGTAVIAGRVVDAETEIPIAGAVLQVRIRKIGLQTTEVVAGPRGEFRLEGLVAGDYTIVASPPELQATHLPQPYNGDMAQIAMGAGPPSLPLSAGERREDIVIKLPRAFAIDGMVVDEGGEPTANVSVGAELVQLRPGGFPAGMGRDIETDDRGVFRLFGLAAGAYRICASPNRDAQFGRPAAGHVFERRYVKTCYPSAPAGGGERIVVGATATVPALTIVMQRSAGYTIAGRVTSESGLASVYANVHRIGEAGSRSVSVEMRDGTFAARGVTPGKYRVSAYAGQQTGPGDLAGGELAEAVIEVVGADVTGLELVTRKGATLVGRIVPSEPLPSGGKLQVLHTLGFEGVATGASVYYRPASVRADLTFQLADIHGNPLFEVSGLPEGWVVTSIRYRGADVTNTSTQVTTTTDPDDLQIHVSPRSAHISGRPVDADGRPVPAALVMVFPAAGDRLSMSSLFGPPKPSKDNFQDLGHVRPGEYRIVAVMLTDMMQLGQDPAKFGPLRDIAQPVSLSAGDRLRVDVLVRPLPEER